MRVYIYYIEALDSRSRDISGTQNPTTDSDSLRDAVALGDIVTENGNFAIDFDNANSKGRRVSRVAYA